MRIARGIKLRMHSVARPRRAALAGLASLAVSGAAFGGTDCGPYKVSAVQAQSGDLLANVVDSSGNYWKEIGPWTGASTKPYQALLQQAAATGAAILLRYDVASYNCGSTDYTTVPVVVRLYSN